MPRSTWFLLLAPAVGLPLAVMEHPAQVVGEVPLYVLTVVMVLLIIAGITIWVMDHE